jgi:hypothetical protein
MLGHFEVNLGNLSDVTQITGMQYNLTPKIMQLCLAVTHAAQEMTRFEKADTYYF